MYVRDACVWTRVREWLMCHTSLEVGNGLKQKNRRVRCRGTAVVPSPRGADRNTYIVLHWRCFPPLPHYLAPALLLYAGCIPSELGRLVALKTLYINFNQLTGKCGYKLCFHRWLYSWSTLTDIAGVTSLYLLYVCVFFLLLIYAFFVLFCDHGLLFSKMG